MSTPDYTSKAEDHQALLILVKQIGENIKRRTFNRLFDKIANLQSIRIPNQQRDVYLRYKKTYSTEDNDWGEFQSHRRVFGLICVGKCENASDFESLKRIFEYQKSQYVSTIFDSRLLILQTDKSDSLSDHGYSSLKRQPRYGSAQSRKGNAGVEYAKEHVGPNNEKSMIPSVTTTLASPSTSENELSPESGGNMDSLNASYIESTAMNASIILTLEEAVEASGVGRETISLDSDSPSGSEMSMENIDVGKAEMSASGSSKISVEISSEKESDRSDSVSLSEVSNCADVWLYQGSAETGGDLEEKIQEFIIRIFWVLESKRLDRAIDKKDKLSLLMAPFEKKTMTGLEADGRNYTQRCLGRLRKHLADLCLLSGLPGEALLHYQVASDCLKSCNDLFWLAGANEGICSASIIINYPPTREPQLRRNLSFSHRAKIDGSLKLKDVSSSSTGTSGLDLATGRSSKSVLPAEDIIDKYKEALNNYSRYKDAGIIAMEASIKACQVLILQKKQLQAAKFLNNVVYINLQLTEEEKIQRYSTLALLYSQIGFQRKAAFFKRVAAMQCIAHQKPGWSQCHKLLLQSLDGYKIPLDVGKLSEDRMSGWPVIQHRVLHELMYSARRMGNPAIAIRHMTFLLRTMLNHLTEQEKHDTSSVLEQYTNKYEALMQPITLECGLVLPPVHLTNLPKACSFAPSSLHPHRRPIKLKSSLKARSDPFIYSPMQLSRKSATKTSCQWVENDVCEVCFQVVNPMPYELKVTNVGLLTDGVMFETYPTNLSLPPESAACTVRILGTPRGSGELRITGYTTTVLGVKSFCPINRKDDHHYSIQVVPALPLLEVATSHPKCDCFSSLGDSADVIVSAAVTLFGGENQECLVTLKNSGCIPIEFVDCVVVSKLQSDLINRVLVWNREDLASQLPIQPNDEALLRVRIEGIYKYNDCDARLTSVMNVSADEQNVSQDFDALLRIQYSGGPGYADSYYRQCSIAFNIEIQPLFAIRSWNVMPSNKPDYCTMILDVTNVSDQTTEVRPNGETLVTTVDSKQTKRIIFDVPHCGSISACNCNEKDLKESGMKLSKSTNIQWKMTANGKSGKLNTDRLVWPSEQLELLNAVFIHWERQ
ncbi:trafficking protein particle complex subunit 9-like [Tubulanus polymorphus]|uniref:trafficking protein particle complex subunit 9-like n=1 Tax=Tubulanus polymorphus TaxID=672921 RepID=UPI003DA3C9EF